MIIVLLALFVVCSDGFLFETTRTPTSSANSISDKHYSMLLDLLADERRARRSLEQNFNQLQQDLKLTKSTITRDFQQLIQNFGNTVGSSKESHNHTLVSEREMEALTSNYSSLRQDYTHLLQNNEILKNRTTFLEEKVSSLMQMKNITDSNVNIVDLKNEITKINTKLNSFSVGFGARNEDLLALINVTTALENDLKNTKLILGNQITLLAQQETKQWNQLSDRVAMTASAVFANYSRGEVIQFSDVVVTNGILNLNDFNNTGIFTCEKPGLYQISSYVATSHQSSCFEISKNNNTMIADGLFSMSYLDFQTSTAIVMERLELNDTLSVKACSDIFVLGSRESGLSILQVL